MTDQAEAFGAKLDLALRLLNVSRGRLAAEAQVDKSLVSRWARGLTAPRGHNLSVLTDIVRARVPGFTQLTWDLPLNDFARALGGGEDSAPAPAPAPAAPPPTAAVPAIDPGQGDLRVSRAQSALEMQREGDAYPGVYIGFRQAFRNTGQIIGDLLIFWRRGDRLFFRQFDPAYSHTGEVFVLHHQLYVVAEDDRRVDGLIFYLLTGVTGRKALRIDGVVSTVVLDRGRSPAASATVLLRLADLEDVTAPPSDEALAAMVERLAIAHRGGEMATLAGPQIVEAVSPVIGTPGPDGQIDRLLLRPTARSLSATEMEWSDTLGEELRALRRAVLGKDDLFPV